MTPMQQATAQLRELFQSLRDAGFSEWQACQIIGSYLAGSLIGGTGEETS